MSGFYFDASSNTIAACTAPRMPNSPSMFLVLYCHGKPSSFVGSIESIALLLSSPANRATLQEIAERHGRPNALADLDAFIYSYVWGV